MARPSGPISSMKSAVSSALTPGNSMLPSQGETRISDHPEADRISFTRPSSPKANGPGAPGEGGVGGAFRSGNATLSGIAAQSFSDSGLQQTNARRPPGRNAARIDRKSVV